jgi:hypothetical protein
MRITLETFLDHAPGAKIIGDRELEWKPDYRLEAVTGLWVDLGPVPA